MDRGLLSTLSEDELTALLRKADGAEQAARAEKVAVVQEVARRGCWRDDGARNVAEWVAGHLPVPARSARQLRRVAAALEELPALAAALAGGDLGWDQVVPLTRFATPAEEAVWVQHGPGLTPETLEAIARRRCRPHEQPGPADALRYRTDPVTGVLRYWGEAVGDAAARFLTAIEGLADTECKPAAGEPLDPWPARCAQALDLLCRQRLGADAHRHRATVNIHVGAQRLVGGPGDASFAHADIPIPDGMLERLACNGRLRLIFDNRWGEPAAYTKAQPPPPPLEHAVRRRDVHCRFPGCRTRRGEIHHITWRTRGGRTIYANLVLLCYLCRRRHK